MSLPLNPVQSTDLVSAFDSLTLGLAQFCELLNQQQPKCWVALGDDEQAVDPLKKARSYYQDIWYRDQQDGRETRSCYGLVMANEAIITLAQEINLAKDTFKSLVQQIQKTDKDLWLSQKAQLNTRHQTLRNQLYYTGLGRIHLKQLYRHIPILPHRPEKIGFTWYSNGRSIKKLTVAQAETKLLAMGEEKVHIQQQLQKLNTLPEHEILAQIQTQVPVVRANLVYKLLNEKGHSETIRKAMNVSLPLLVPEESSPLLPSFNQIDEQPPVARTRIARSDFKICEEMFLPSLRVHRYL
ncbi:MAG: DNA replication terminus site-binding protein [Oleispira sp.]|nr:DNA replication terminus site-binding protein [Oleispira sp.]